MESQKESEGTLAQPQERNAASYSIELSNISGDNLDIRISWRSI